MTYQLYIRHNRSLSNDTVGLYFLTFLSLLTLNTLSVAFYYFSNSLILLNIVLGVVLLGLIVAPVFKRPRVPFIYIADETLNYWDPEKDEMVSVLAKDIIQISTKLGQMNLHTKERIHPVNLNLIKKAHTRWEIKEKIRSVAAC